MESPASEHRQGLALKADRIYIRLTTGSSSTLKLNTLRPQRRDIRFALGDLEAVTLRALWEADKPRSVRELQTEITRTRPVAATTVATILDRLYRKGIALRTLVREGGPHYVYSARLTETEFKHEVVSNVMNTLLQGFNDVTVAYLAEKMSDQRRDRHLSSYLDRLRIRAKK